MYPSGINQNRDAQKGTFVEVKGYGDEMEGKSRPGFFRGVATVVVKLFNVIQVGSTLSCHVIEHLVLTSIILQPTNTYFGQKDIQQALLLRRLTRDLLLSHPTPSSLHIIPTTRDLTSGLALSSRNAYLTSDERNIAGGTLYKALRTAEQAWMNGEMKDECVKKARRVIEDVAGRKETKEGGVNVKLDYVEMNDADNFEVVSDGEVKDTNRDAIILSGAIWVGRTRLIDNLILGAVGKILS
jgi:pantoate--beta-alanine ligase